MPQRHHATRSNLLRHLLAGSAALLIPAGLALADESAVSAQAEHTAMACDRKIAVSELSGLVAPKAKKPYHIELSVPSLANPYIVAVIYGATLAAKDAEVMLSIDSGKGFMDPASQIRQVENALSRKTDALLINPADPNGMVATIDDAVESGVPVFDVGTLSSSGKSYKVVQDDYSQGKIAAEVIARLLPNGGSGIVQGGPANATWARRRVAGFSDALKEDPKLTISAVNNEDINPTEGLEKFSNSAQSHPKVDWIYATFNILLPPPSIPPEYRGAVYVGGAYDPIMVASIKDGAAAAAIPDFPVSVGYVGISAAVERLNGGTVPMRTCIPSTAITKDNVNDPVWSKSNDIPAGWQVPAR